jgi:sigma-B regulation protein RsbU (phosphoserine phosphatase)
MGTATASRILLCADSAAAVEDMLHLLAQDGHAAGWHPLDAADPRDLTTYDLVVLDCGQRDQETLQLCQRIRTRLADRVLPILLIAPGPNPATRLAGLECGADACLVRPFMPNEFLAQVHAFLRLKRRHDRLAEKAAEFARVHQQLQQAYQQLDQDLDLSRRIQQSLLPRSLPDMPPARFAVCYRPCGRVGGDFYDVFRLDEDHVGFYVADVVGHGVPAGLLTIFLKKALRFKEISGRDYRLLSPHEVLQHLNRDMIDQAVADNPFITMVYAVFDRRDGSLSFARAGHPHPIHVPRGGEPKLWQLHGTLLGVFETQFTTQTSRLRPGDKLLLHTDGLDSLNAAGKPSATERLLALAARYGKLPVQEFVDQLCHDALEQASQPDDFTLLGLEIGDG